MKRTIALAVAALMMLGILAGPAAAMSKAYVAVTGTAEVSKTQFFNETTCGNLPGVGTTGGLGLPIVTGVKKGYWRLAMPLINVTDPLNGANLLACGKLNPVARALTGAATMDNDDDGGIGAACGMSKGYDGRGRITDPDEVIELTNIVWKVTAGGSILALGHARWATPSKADGKLVAEVNAQGAGCTNKGLVDPTEALEKNPEKSPEGAKFFTVNGVAEIIQDPAGDVVPKWNNLPTSPKGAEDNPAFCKRDAATCPVYGPKKQHDNP